MFAFMKVACHDLSYRYVQKAVKFRQAGLSSQSIHDASSCKISGSSSPLQFKLYYHY